MRLGIVAALTGVIACGIAPASAAAAPEPVELLRAADAKLARTQSLQYNAESRGWGARGPDEPLVRAEVHVDRLKIGRPDQWRLAVRGTIATPDPTFAGLFEVYGDDDGAMLFKHATHEAVVARAADIAGLLDECGTQVTWWLVEWKTLVEPALQGGAVRATLLGQRSVAGELCEVVRLDASALDEVETDTWWYISVTDHLPRRVDKLVHSEDGPGIISVELSGMKAPENLDPGVFRHTQPFDYTVREYEPAAVPVRFRGRARGLHAAGAIVPDFQLTTPTGQLRRLTDVRGRTVVLVFWAAWSKPCLQTLRELGPLRERHAGDPLTVWALSTGDRGEAAPVFAGLKLPFETLVEAEPVAKRLGIVDVPAIVVIGPDGRAITVVTGGGEAEIKQVTEAVEKSLRESK